MDASFNDTPVNATCNNIVSVAQIFTDSMTEHPKIKILLFSLLILETLLILAILFFSIKSNFKR